MHGSKGIYIIIYYMVQNLLDGYKVKIEISMMYVYCTEVEEIW
jgi:hypothetical protein